MIEARKKLKDAKKIVIKIGTSSLVYPNGKTNLRRIQALARVISDLMNEGRKIVLVSSGAIGLGVDKLKLAEKPSTVAGRQAVAAVGQVSLMQAYGRAFEDYGFFGAAASYKVYYQQGRVETEFDQYLQHADGHEHHPHRKRKRHRSGRRNQIRRQR